ncbi:MAG: hypothetical protein ACX98W_19810 [bacterium]
MSKRVRRILAGVSVVLMLSAVGATTAGAQTRAQGDSANAPAAVDVAILRPAGFVGLVIGTGLFLATLPIVVITRPHEIGTPFKHLVGGPARYVWGDPIGEH